MDRVLAIDTSSRLANVALLQDKTVLAQASGASPHSASLLPTVKELLGGQGCSLDELSMLAVAKGPGSYTGLRIGVVTAKSLCRGLGVPLVGVATLPAMAAHCPTDGPARILVALHAYKRRVLIATYEREVGGRLELQGPTALVEACTLSPRFDGTTELVTDAADLVDVTRDWGGITVLKSGPGAAMVGERALERLSREGTIDETYSLSPEYSRPPAVTRPKRKWAEP